jgi:hypothetical protein
MLNGVDEAKKSIMGRVCGNRTQNTNFHTNLFQEALQNVDANLTQYS